MFGNEQLYRSNIKAKSPLFSLYYRIKSSLEGIWSIAKTEWHCDKFYNPSMKASASFQYFAHQWLFIFNHRSHPRLKNIQPLLIYPAFHRTASVGSYT